MNRSTFEEKTFVQTLFDFSFTSFITLRFLKVIYVIAMIAIGIGALGIIVSASRGGVGGFVVGLIAAVVIGGIYLIVTRIWLELIALFFRISENAATTAETLSQLVNDEPPATATAATQPASAAAPAAQPAPAPVYAPATPVAPPPAPPAPPASPTITYAPPVAPAQPSPPAMAPPPEPPRTATLPPPPNPHGLQPPTS